MKYYKHPFLFLLFFVSATLTACKDDEDPVADLPPTITITSPTEAEMQTGFSAGQNITLKGTATDDGTLTTLHFEAYTQSGQQLYSESREDLNVAEYTIEQDIAIPGFTPSGDYKLVLTAVDNGGQETKVEQLLKIK